MKIGVFNLNGSRHLKKLEGTKRVVYIKSEFSSFQIKFKVNWNGSFVFSGIFGFSHNFRAGIVQTSGLAKWGEEVIHLVQKSWFERHTFNFKNYIFFYLPKNWIILGWRFQSHLRHQKIAVWQKKFESRLDNKAIGHRNDHQCQRWRFQGFKWFALSSILRSWLGWCKAGASA